MLPLRSAKRELRREARRSPIEDSRPKLFSRTSILSRFPRMLSRPKLLSRPPTRLSLLSRPNILSLSRPIPNSRPRILSLSRAIPSSLPKILSLSLIVPPLISLLAGRPPKCCDRCIENPCGAPSLFSLNAIHNSVRLLHIPSALLLTKRSLAMDPTAGGGPPGLPVVPTAPDSATASCAADSRYLYTSGAIMALLFARAACSSGWVLLLGPLVVEPVGDTPEALFRGLLEMVVTVVVAVHGRSPEELLVLVGVRSVVMMLPTPLAGMRPVSSRRRIRDLRSSSSSQTVLGAVVDTEDESSGPPSAPSAPSLLVSGRVGVIGSMGFEEAVWSRSIITVSCWPSLGEECSWRGATLLARDERARAMGSAIEYERV